MFAAARLFGKSRPSRRLSSSSSSSNLPRRPNALQYHGTPHDCSNRKKAQQHKLRLKDIRNSRHSREASGSSDLIMSSSGQEQQPSTNKNSATKESSRTTSTHSDADGRVVDKAKTDKEELEDELKEVRTTS